MWKSTDIDDNGKISNKKKQSNQQNKMIMKNGMQFMFRNYC